MKKISDVLLLLSIVLLFSPIAVAEEYLVTEEMNSSTHFGNIFLTIPSGFEKVYPGENLIANVKLMNLRSDSRVDVVLDFIISDPDENVIFSKKETIAVETQASLVRTFAVPEDAIPGRYNVYINLIYADGNETAAQASFLVAEKPSDKDYFAVYAVIGAIIFLALIIYLASGLKEALMKFRLKMRIRGMIRRRFGYINSRPYNPDHF